MTRAKQSPSGQNRSPRLRAATAALEYQRQWFTELQAAAADGEQIALVNADVPHEILRAMDIPYVVSQWWSSIVAAKGGAPGSLNWLAQNGYPDRRRQYETIPLGSMSLDPESAPWGGLPRPSIVIAELSGDAVGKMFDAWNLHYDSAFFPFERTAAVPAPSRWWDLVAHDWESAFGTPRLDLMTAENDLLVEFLEKQTGKTFSLERLSAIMDLANEQAEWNRRSRDLIAAARPVPVRVQDTMPAVMIPQWHRGSEWAVSAAQALYQDLAERIDGGQGVTGQERLRLMWVGRGLWSDLSMYSHFEERYGAVFVWSMYLAIAADGYARYGDDPMRALAARFAGLTDQLYAPPWSTEWYVKEAQTHGVDAAIHLVADDVPGPSFITEALEANGIPTLQISFSNADPRALDREGMVAEIDRFLEIRLGADSPKRANHSTDVHPVV